MVWAYLWVTDRCECPASFCTVGAEAPPVKHSVMKKCLRPWRRVCVTFAR